MLTPGWKLELACEAVNSLTSKWVGTMLPQGALFSHYWCSLLLLGLQKTAVLVRRTFSSSAGRLKNKVPEAQKRFQVKKIRKKNPLQIRMVGHEIRNHEEDWGRFHVHGKILKKKSSSSPNPNPSPGLNPNPSPSPSPNPNPNPWGLIARDLRKRVKCWMFIHPTFLFCVFEPQEQPPSPPSPPTHSRS